MAAQRGLAGLAWLFAMLASAAFCVTVGALGREAVQDDTCESSPAPSLHLLQSVVAARRAASSGAAAGTQTAEVVRPDYPQCLNPPFESPSWASMWVLSFLALALVTGLCWFLATPAVAVPQDLVGTGQVSLASEVQRSNGLCSTDAVKDSDVRGVQILCLDGLRTIFILLVIAYHSSTQIHVPHPLEHAEWSMQYFFVLSGFVAVYTKADRKIAARPCGAAHFVARRMARICPMYLCIVWWNAVAEVLLRSPMPTSTPLQFTQSWPIQALMIQSLLPLKICQGNVWGFEPSLVGWFVSAILLLSALFPLLSRLLPSNSVRRTIGMLACAVVLRSVPTYLKQFLPVSPNGYQGWLEMYQFMPLRIPEFFGGMLAARLFQEASPGLVAWRGWAWVAEAVVVLSPVWVYRFWPDEMGLGYGDFLLTGPCCVLCFAACCASQETGAPNGGLILRALTWSPLVWLSEYAYGAYLAQDIFFHSAMNFGLHKRPANLVMRVVLSTPLCFFASFLLIEVERAIARLVEQRIKGKAMF
mmetsp:Transcript_8335/g.21155  ORF Transcript_8335/g.21155 Transcript_8335/m.21155 type:complete len:530 (+) Transcript_8335:59-1648(+)